MKMPLFHKFNHCLLEGDWSKNPELGLIDTLLETHPELLDFLKGTNKIHEYPNNKFMLALSLLFHLFFNVGNSRALLPLHNIFLTSLSKSFSNDKFVMRYFQM